MKQEKKIRYGIMCDEKEFHKWQAEAVKEINKLDNTELVLLIMNSEKQKTKGVFSILNKIRPRNFLFQIYNKFISNPPAERVVDMHEALQGIDVIHCEVKKEGKFSQYFTKEDLEEIDNYDLDFILKFGFGIIRGEINQAPRYGVWSFHHADEKKYRGVPSCFWGIYKGDSVTGAILQKLTDRLDGGVVLKKGFFKTVNYSYSKNVNQAYMESSRWPAQVCTDIVNDNAEYLHNSPTKTDAPIFHQPNNFQFIVFLFKLAKNFLRRCYQMFFETKWNVGIIRNPIQFLLDAKDNEIEWLSESQGKGKFKADPFGIKEKDVITVLFEDYDYKTGKGIISGMKISSGEKIVQKEGFVEQPFHLSYPYLIEYKGDIFCVPESAEANEIALYKAEKFPETWKKVKVLVDNVKGVDSTVFQYQDYWWLTCTKAQNPDLNLFVYWSKKLMGPWKPHFNNPVKTDIRSSRPAGTPFMYQNQLYRPAQDCSDRYGGKIVINKLIRLSKKEFEEKVAAEINPYSPYTEGIHTISAVGDITLIDGAHNVLSLTHFLGEIKERLSSNQSNSTQRFREN